MVQAELRESVTWALTEEAAEEGGGEEEGGVRPSGGVEAPELELNEEKSSRKEEKESCEILQCRDSRGTKPPAPCSVEASRRASAMSSDDVIAALALESTDDPAVAPPRDTRSCSPAAPSFSSIVAGLLRLWSSSSSTSS